LIVLYGARDAESEKNISSIEDDAIFNLFYFSRSARDFSRDLIGVEFV
jgi:hypothetical protein